MKKFNLVLLFVSFSISLSSVAFANSDHKMPIVEMPKSFDTLKSLVGTWEGSSDMGDGKQTPVVVVYELTSGGTAISEKLMPGTPHEMVSIYHKEGKSLGMTHFCALGNQPHMKLKKAESNRMAFEMAGTSGISSSKEPHMHALTLTMADSDSLKQEWVHFAGGKKGMTAVFEYKRKK